MRVLTWNLFHGRSEPPAGRDLQAEFTALIASWEWDVALLQEVPPWWPRPIAQASGAHMRMARTSRNDLLPVRKLLARRWPDLIKSGGGGCNAILVRGQAITLHHRYRLRWLPEQRVVHAVRLANGVWVANIHAHVRPHSETRRDLSLAGTVATSWAAGEPVLLGGDCNVRDPSVTGFTHLGGRGVDHLLGRRLDASGQCDVLERHGMSDHAALLLRIEPI